MHNMKYRLFHSLILLGFVLGCHQGRIALWKDTNPNPVRVFPYPVTSLPHADQQLLMDGIPIADETELARLLEDYLS